MPSGLWVPAFAEMTGGGGLLQVSLQPRPGDRWLERHTTPAPAVILGSTQDPEPQRVAFVALDPGFRQDDGWGWVVWFRGAVSAIL